MKPSGGQTSAGCILSFMIIFFKIRWHLQTRGGGTAIHFSDLCNRSSPTWPQELIVYVFAQLYPWGLSQGSSHHKKECLWVLWFNWELDNFRTPCASTHVHMCMQTHTHKLSAPASWTWSFLHLLLISCLWSRDLPCSAFSLWAPSSWLSQILLRNGQSQISSLWGPGMIWKWGPFTGGLAIVDNDL